MNGDEPMKTIESTLKGHKVVSREEWVAARKELLVKEKESTRMRDQLSGDRRKLPWVKVEKDYFFDTPGRQKSLAALFDGRSQLVIYHFMFGRTVLPWGDFLGLRGQRLERDGSV